MSRVHRILSLDGGGIRGVISVEVLHGIETVLREATGRPELRLCDWFDLIAGTSTGAITAALLATGHSVADIRRFYDEEAATLFQPAGLRQLTHYRYDAQHIARRLQSALGAETTLGSERIQPLLLLVLRNATTDSPWFLTNNPNSRYNDRAHPGCNLDIPLWQLVRASSAAPTFFEPEVIRVGGARYVFSDGGVTGYANPAFKAFLVATVEPYGFSWSAGVENLLLVSLGTGRRSLADPALNPAAMHRWYHARELPRALLSSAHYQQDLLCRVFGECLEGEALDGEVGDLIGARGPAEPRLFTYVRYDVDLTPAGLERIGWSHSGATRLAALDGVENLTELKRIGTALATARVRPTHFTRFVAAARD